MWKEPRYTFINPSTKWKANGNKKKYINTCNKKASNKATMTEDNIIME